MRKYRIVDIDSCTGEPGARLFSPYLISSRAGLKQRLSTYPLGVNMDSCLRIENIPSNEICFIGTLYNAVLWVKNI